MVPDTSKEPDYIPPPSGQLHAELAIPIIDGNTCLGVLNLEHEDTGAFSASDVELLQTLAKAVSPPLPFGTRKSIARCRQRAQFLLNLYSVGQQFIADLDLPRVLEAVVAGAANVLGANLATLFVRKTVGVNAAPQP